MKGSLPPVKFVKPILDVPTRWNSTYDMLVRAIRMRTHLQILAVEYRDDFPLTPLQWSDIERLTQFLKPFKDITQYVNGDQYCTISAVVPFYNTLFDHLDKAIAESDETSVIYQAAVAAKVKLEKYYSETSHAYTIATFIDPRFRLEYYQDSDENGGEISWQEIKQIAKSKFDLYYTLYTAPESIDEPIDEVNLSAVDLCFKRKRKVVVNAKNEFDIYCAETSEKSMDPINWWKYNCARFPILSRMARDYLAIPGTSTSSEREFSSSRRLITDFRTSLSPNTVQAVQCLKSWGIGK
jgi:hypothetical protein